MAMSRRHVKEENGLDEDGEKILAFLERELPPGRTTQAPYLTKVLLNVGKRYQHYSNRINEWQGYGARRTRFARLAHAAAILVSELETLDVVSYDDLANRLYPKEIESLAGSMRVLGRKAIDLGKTIQKNGPPYNLAFERWVFELAHIYTNAFGESPRAWEVEHKAEKRKSKFYRLLEVSLPNLTREAGALSPRQVQRVLKRRPKEIRLTLIEGIAALKEAQRP
jgi:hypothetical protein